MLRRKKIVTRDRFGKWFWGELTASNPPPPLIAVPSVLVVRHLRYGSVEHALVKILQEGPGTTRELFERLQKTRANTTLGTVRATLSNGLRKKGYVVRDSYGAWHWSGKTDDARI